jgi:hypothetical protein
MLVNLDAKSSTGSLVVVPGSHRWSEVVSASEKSNYIPIDWGSVLRSATHSCNKVISLARIQCQTSAALSNCSIFTFASNPNLDIPTSSLDARGMTAARKKFHTPIA